MTQDTLHYLHAHHDRILAELREFVSIPSVSTDPTYAEGVLQAANWVAEHLRGAGIEQVQVLPTSQHPIVYGEWLHAPTAPTILVYGHYDVQPPEPLEKWHSAPFGPVLRQGRLYGRGTSDDKGPMLIPLKVAEAYRITTGALPLNVKFLFEGEEEIGSPSLKEFIKEHKQMLAADFALSADGAMWRIDIPSVNIASRGITGLEFTLSGAAKDLHSGRHGGAVANPLHAIAEVVASLHHPDGSVAVKGFYDDVLPLSTQERAAMAALPFDYAGYLAQVGAPTTFGETGHTTLERLWTRPTLEINGLWGGYQGLGSKTVIPSEAHAKITCRLVANQTPEDISTKVIHHLETHIPPGVTLTIRGDDKHNALPYQIPADHPGLQVAEAVLKEIYNQAPVRVRMGGTLPVSELFLQLLGIYTIFFSFSTADEDFHAPNEFFRVDRLHEGLAAWAKYWAQLGKS
ncbi:MAG: dipeptidase [Chloroflexi bacterium]|nr:dipeptidase [Chloroflexota bacterium]